MSGTENCSIIERIHGLAGIDELYDAGEPRPSSSTVALAAKIVSNSIEAISTAAVTDWDIHPFDGAIRIVWTCGPRTLKLIVSSGKSYLYSRDVDASDDSFANLSYDLSAESIGRWMCWISGAQVGLPGQ